MVLRIRQEVLFNEDLQVARQGDIQEEQTPNDETLIAQLFIALKLKPQDKKVKTTGGELSKNVLPLNQLRQISKIMADVIREAGGVELKRAKMRSARDWEGLRHEYAAEKAASRPYQAYVSDEAEEAVFWAGDLRDPISIIETVSADGDSDFEDALEPDFDALSAPASEFGVTLDEEESLDGLQESAPDAEAAIVDSPGHKSRYRTEARRLLPVSCTLCAQDAASGEGFDS